MKYKYPNFCLIFILISCRSNEPTPPSEMNVVTWRLDSIYLSDQANRGKVDSISKSIERYKKMMSQTLRIMTPVDSVNLSNDKKGMDSLWSCIHKQDAINLSKVEKILDQYGWLGADVISEEGNATLFLVIQHADLKTQEKYLPMMKEAVKNKKAKASDLALLIDRVEVGNNRPQIYGSQINGTPGAYTVFSIKDEINVNKRRADVGLQPLEEYVKYWDMEYHLPAK